jgi:2-polyprenyl-3-methyl-5-hydroxy-6-metoxy-1,4-benzoquinol methylase
MTELFVAAGATVVAVDRAETYLARAADRGLDGVELVEGDIVTIDRPERFAHVVLANVVHEVPDPSALYATAARHLAPGGHLHVSLQNPGSIHRLLGRAMGLIAELGEVSERGQAFETIEVLDADQLEALGRGAGLEPVHRGGVMLKPLPNALMAELPDEVLEGFVHIGPDLPELASMNHLVFQAHG